MKVHQVKIENTTVTHVYISEEEYNIKNKEKIEELKENNKVVIFRAGNKSTKEVLRNMIQEMTK